MICSKCGEDQHRDQFGPSAENWPSHRECRTCGRTKAQIRRHGMTAEEREVVAAHQGGCAICGHPEPSSRGWVVDHDRQHCPGEKSCQECRRGIVCSYCNTMLGFAFDRVETLTAAIAYLTREPSHDWHAPLPCAVRLCGVDANRYA